MGKSLFTPYTLKIPAKRKSARNADNRNGFRYALCFGVESLNTRQSESDINKNKSMVFNALSENADVVAVARMMPAANATTDITR